MSHNSPLMSAREREIARLCVAGLSQTDIAKQLGINRRTVTRALEREPVRLHIGKLQDDLDTEIIRAMVYNPFVGLIQPSLQPRKSRRRRKL